MKDLIGSCLHPVTKSTCFRIRLQHVRVPIRQQYIHDPIEKIDSLSKEYSLHRSNPHDEAYWHDDANRVSSIHTCSSTA